MDNSITQRTRKILAELPPRAEAAAAAKTRTPEEVRAALAGGIRIIAHNYVQEAEKMFPRIGRTARWHLIGKLQRNKAGRAVRLFDMIETADSVKLCEALDKHCRSEGKIMPLLLQINIAGESSKSGISPGEAGGFLEEAGKFRHVSVQGLMTIEPFALSAEESRKYFKRMKELFDELKTCRPEAAGFKYLSMGMSRTYKTAVEEGANIVRIGTTIFGARKE